MKKYLSFAIFAIAALASCVKQPTTPADNLELLSAETVTVPAKGGEALVELKSQSKLQAVSASDWVKAEVLDNFTVKLVVDAFTGDEARSTSVSITNEHSTSPVRVKVNQNAVTFTFTPEDHQFEAAGGKYSYEYVSEAPLEVSAEAEWLTYEVAASELIFNAAANENIKARTVEVNWHIGKSKGTFNISQKGADATLESPNFKDGNFEDVTAALTGAEVSYPYTTNSELEVNCDDAWVEVYVEDNVFHINVAANEGEPRESYVYWSVKGSKTLQGNFKVSQKGAFCTAYIQPGKYTPDPESNETNTIGLIVSGTGVKSFKYLLGESSNFDGKTEAQLHQQVKSSGRDFQAAWLDYVNQNGLNLSLTGCDPDTHYTLLAYAVSEGGDEAYFISNSKTLGEYIWDEFSVEDGYETIPSKDFLYGKYLFLAKSTENFNEGFTDREVQGNVEITDGESSVDEEGNTYDWINVSGIWNSNFNSKYGLTNDITQFDLYNGFLYMQDSESLGDLIEKASGEVFVPAFMTLTKFEGKTNLYQLYGHIAGGMIDEDGTIAFFDTKTFAEKKGADGEVLGDVAATLLYSDDEDKGGWYAAFRDFMLVPLEKATPARIAAARKTAAKIQKEIWSMPKNYVELRDSRVERAIRKVRAEGDGMFHAATRL